MEDKYCEKCFYLSACYPARLSYNTHLQVLMFPPSYQPLFRGKFSSFIASGLYLLGFTPTNANKCKMLMFVEFFSYESYFHLDTLNLVLIERNRKY